MSKIFFSHDKIMWYCFVWNEYSIYNYIATFNKCYKFCSAMNKSIIKINTLYCATQHKFKYVILTKEKQNRKWAENNTSDVYLYIILSDFMSCYVLNVLH